MLLRMTDPVRTRRRRTDNGAYEDYGENYDEGLDDLVLYSEEGARGEEDDDDDDGTDWDSDWDSSDEDSDDDDDDEGAGEEMARNLGPFPGHHRAFPVGQQAGPRWQ
jgi:hypothetical protein